MAKLGEIGWVAPREAHDDKTTEHLAETGGTELPCYRNVGYSGGDVAGGNITNVDAVMARIEELFENCSVNGFSIDEIAAKQFCDVVRPIIEKLTAQISMLQLENCKNSSVCDSFHNAYLIEFNKVEKYALQLRDLKAVLAQCECERDTATDYAKEQLGRAEELEREVQFHRGALGGLLAVLHRDGGHYVDEHGIKQAVENAIAEHYAMRDVVEHARKLSKWIELQRIAWRPTRDDIKDEAVNIVDGLGDSISKLDALKGDDHAIIDR